MPPLTPFFADTTVNQTLLKALPDKLRAPYSFLLEKSLKSPEVATYCTYLVAAVMGNPDACKRVLEIMFAAHFLRHRARTAEQIAVTNAMVYAANILAETMLRAEEVKPEESKPEAPKPEASKPAAPKSTPIKKAEQRKKPAPTFSKKPGHLVSEK